jgi:general secretion pathway protein G
MHPGRHSRPHRRAFTLVELLTTIVIIALLAALLLPAIGAAVRSARSAAVTAEINQMAQALADFRSKYGDHPPSRVILNENGNFGSTGSGAVPYTTTQATSPAARATARPDGDIAQRTIAALRKFWPRAYLSTTGPVFTAPYGSGWYDFNGNGGTAPDGPAYLGGDECLVFFLGGIPQQVASPGGGKSTFGVTGFARNPVNPFQGAGVANRQPPFFEFKSERLVDLDGDGFPSYLDSLGTDRPYAYFSSYGGTGYDPDDVNLDSGPLAESDDAGTTSPIALKFRVPFATAGGSASAGFYEISSGPNPYTAGVTAPASGTVTYQQPQTFQILSAGGDGLYGVGGSYNPKAPTPLPLDPTATTPATDPNLRSRERDNLTSFTTGRLD